MGLVPVSTRLLYEGLLVEGASFNNFNGLMKSLSFFLLLSNLNISAVAIMKFPEEVRS